MQSDMPVPSVMPAVLLQILTQKKEPSLLNRFEYYSR